MPKQYNVYSFLFPDGTRFVGLASGESMKYWGRKGTGFRTMNPPLYEKIQECGWESIQWNILLETESKEDAYAIRNQYRKKYKDAGIWFKERSSNKNVVEEVLHDFVAEMTAKLDATYAYEWTLGDVTKDTIKDMLLDCQSDVYHKHVKGGK